MGPKSHAPAPSVVILAAGSSSRFSGSKQLAEIDGRSLLERAVRAVPPQIEETIVVLGPLASAAKKAAPSAREVRFVLNRGYRTGIASSIRAGVRALSPDAPGVIILLADQPFVDKILVGRILRAFSAKVDGIAAADNGEVSSPPVAFSRRFFPELLALRGDTGAKSVIERHKDSVVLVRSRPNQLMDIDTVQDLRAARRLAEARKTRKQVHGDRLALPEHGVAA